MRVRVVNEEPAGSAGVLTVTVVTVGRMDAEEVKHLLGPQEGVMVDVDAGQFVMVDEQDKEG
jgi:hypothetical protein